MIKLLKDELPEGKNIRVVVERENVVVVQKERRRRKGKKEREKWDQINGPQFEVTRVTMKSNKSWEVE